MVTKPSAEWKWEFEFSFQFLQRGICSLGPCMLPEVMLCRCSRLFLLLGLAGGAWALGYWHTSCWPWDIWESVSSVEPLAGGAWVGGFKVLVLLYMYKTFFHVCACVLSCFSCVRLFATPWTVARQAPLPMGFSRQEYKSGLPCPSSRGSSRPRDWTWVSCLSRWILYHWASLGSLLSHILSTLKSIWYLSHGCAQINTFSWIKGETETGVLLSMIGEGGWLKRWTEVALW